MPLKNRTSRSPTATPNMGSWAVTSARSSSCSGPASRCTPEAGRRSGGGAGSRPSPLRHRATLHRARPAATVASMDLSLFFLGTAGSVPSARRGLPAVLIRRGGDRLLYDCGEGTQRQLLRSVGLLDLDAVFITHFHADHWLGLPGMLKSFQLRDRTEPLTVYGPRGLGELMS